MGFSRPTYKYKKVPLFSWIIRVVEQTPYSHCYLEWYSPKFDEFLRYEASGTSVHFSGEISWKHKAEAVEKYEVEISEECYQKMIKWCIRHADLPYGMKQVVGIAVVKIAGAFGRKIRNPFASGNKTWVCSELVGFIIEEVVGEDVDEDLDIAGPRKINEIVRASEKFRRVA